MAKLTLRLETPADIAGIRKVNLSAFPSKVEADLVDAIRATCPAAISIVARDRETVVGHIQFTPVIHDSPNPLRGGMALGPMAVLPEYQRKGVGAALIELGLARLVAQRCPFLVVLGHPTYYPKFGFMPAGALGVGCQWPDVPKYGFMILVLDEKKADRLAGSVKYRPEFDRAV